jgi:hypothetical protein
MHYIALQIHEQRLRFMSQEKLNSVTLYLNVHGQEQLRLVNAQLLALNCSGGSLINATGRTEVLLCTFKQTRGITLAAVESYTARDTADSAGLAVKLTVCASIFHIVTNIKKLTNVPPY